MQLQGSEILTFFHSYQFNYSYHGSKVLVLGKGQQEICKTEFNFDAAHMQNKKINKKHTLYNKESLSELDARAFCANSFPSIPGMGSGGEREVRAKHVPIFVAPTRINCFKRRSYKAVLGSGVWGLLGAHAHTDAGSAPRSGSKRREKPPRLAPPLNTHRSCFGAR